MHFLLYKEQEPNAAFASFGGWKGQMKLDAEG